MSLMKELLRAKTVLNQLSETDTPEFTIFCDELQIGNLKLAREEYYKLESWIQSTCVPVEVTLVLLDSECPEQCHLSLDILYEEFLKRQNRARNKPIQELAERIRGLPNADVIFDRLCEARDNGVFK